MKGSNTLPYFVIIISALAAFTLAEMDLENLEKLCKAKCFILNDDGATKHRDVAVDSEESRRRCLKQCKGYDMHGILEKQGIIDGIEILGPHDKIPKDLWMPKKIPQIPLDFLNPGQYPLPKKTECDSAPVASLKEPVPGQVRGVTVRCMLKDQKEPHLQVQWRSPETGLHLVSGYQIFYGFLSGGSYLLKEPNCKVVSKNTTNFVISLDGGLRSGPVLLAVKAFPNQAAFRISLTKYKGCQDDLLERHRRSLKLPSFLWFGNKTEKTEILGTDDTVPPGLIFPTQSNRPLPDDAIGRECGSPYYENRTTPIISVSNLRLICEFSTQNKTESTRVGYAQWSMPEGSENSILGFQVFYSVMRDWTYDPQKTFCIEVGRNIRSVRITEGVTDTTAVKLNVAPLPIYSGQQLPLNTFYCTKRKSTVAPLPDDSPPLGAIFGGVAAAIAVLAAIATYNLRRRRKRSGQELQPVASTGPVAYFSHCFQSHKDIERLLALAARLTGFHGISCRIDLLEQRLIDQVTLSVWCNLRLAESDKVVVVVNKKYLRTWQQHVQSKGRDLTEKDEDVCKILNDLCYIQQHLMETGERTAKIICLLSDGVHRSDLPDFLRRRPMSNWPSNDDTMADFVSCIKGYETRVLSV